MPPPQSINDRSMLRLATVTFYGQEEWLIRKGLLPGLLIYKDITCGRLVSVGEIQAAVALYFKLPVRVMSDGSRYREHARPRQVAMYLSRQLTPMSLPEIGRRFGRRDHTTVIHAIRRIEKLMAEGSEIALAVLTLKKELEA